MRKDKIRAYELRREGKSYKEIHRLLHIPLGTLAGWFKNEEWSKQLREVLGATASLSSPHKRAAIQKTNKARWAKKYDEYRTQAELEFEHKKNRPLFVAGVMLYWGQGNKVSVDSHVKFSNGDPMMIRVFYSFLTQELEIPEDKISLHLLLYPDLKDEMQKRFWSRSLSVPLIYFRKSIYLRGKQSTRRLSSGSCNVNISSRELKEKVLVWINLFQKDLA